MRRGRRGSHSPIEFGGSGEDSFVAVVVTKLTGALLFILLLAMVIMALLPKADGPVSSADVADGDRPDSPPLLSITTPGQLPEAIQGRAYNLALAASGGRGILRWSLDGKLPDGLSFEPGSGTIAGTPRKGTHEPVRLVAHVDDGLRRDSRPLSLTIYQPSQVLSLPNTLRRSLNLLPWRTWLEQGFGFLLLLLVHQAGMNSLRELERRGQLRFASLGVATPVGRYRLYRNLLRLASALATISLAAWLWQLAQPIH